MLQKRFYKSQNTFLPKKLMLMLEIERNNRLVEEVVNTGSFQEDPMGLNTNVDLHGVPELAAEDILTMIKNPNQHSYIIDKQN